MDSQTAPRKLILVEDEGFVRTLYERVFKTDFLVLSAEDGEAGWALIEKESKLDPKPSIILLDIMMPKLNGIQVLKKIKSDSNTKNIPVIMLTNLGQDDIIKQALSMGANEYLVKMHLTPYDVLAHIKDFLQNPAPKPQTATP